MDEDYLEHFGVKGMKWGQSKGGGVEVSSSKKVPIDKVKLKASRKEIYTDVARVYTSRRKVGAAVAASLLFKPAIGSAVIGTQMMRGAGYPKGKSFAVGALSGPLGAVVAIEMKARSNARANS